MKLKVLESIITFGWLALVFFWAHYANIPRGSTEFLLKTIPIILIGTIFINLIFNKYKKKKKNK